MYVLWQRINSMLFLGAYVFWEFATDYYDLGFGVYFEWTDSPEQQVSVTVGETSDEDSDDGKQPTFSPSIA